MSDKSLWCVRTEGPFSGCPTEVRQGSQFTVRRIFQRDQPVVRRRLRAQNFVELALGHRLLSSLRVLEDEDQHDRHRGTRTVEDVLPPRREARRETNCDPAQ